MMKGDIDRLKEEVIDLVTLLRGEAGMDFVADLEVFGGHHRRKSMDGMI